MSPAAPCSIQFHVSFYFLRRLQGVVHCACGSLPFPSCSGMPAGWRQAATGLRAPFLIWDISGLGCPVLWVPVSPSGRTVTELLTVGVCPQKQGIPSPQEDEQLLEGAGRETPFLRCEEELGRLLRPCHHGSFPSRGCQTPFSLPAAPGRPRPSRWDASHLAAETVCIILYPRPGGI